MEKIKVNYVNEGIVYEAEKGKLLSKINEEAGFAQDLVCGGNGKCGKCAVEISIDNVDETVLACQYEVMGDIEVKRIHNLANRLVNVLTSDLELEGSIDPFLRTLRIKGSDMDVDHCTSFAEVVKEKFKLQSFSYEAMKKLARYGTVTDPERSFNLIIFKKEVIDILIDDDEDVYGFAIDIGSTTIAGYLYNMNTLELMGTYSALNQQTALGADVISRIGYAIKEENGTEVMQKKVIDTINQLMEGAKGDGYDPERIYHMVLCGNSTMQHLFLDFYPGSLGRAPFVSATRDFVEINGNDCGVNMNDNGKITFLPLLGGFVGADTTAVLIGIKDDDKPRVIIDLGTNGEIAVGTDEDYLVASTACGPALEGAGLSCGMRAADGAIQHFDIDDDQNIVLDVIGNVPSIGICGSGIIDILAELLRHKIFNNRGKMFSQEEYVALFGADKLSPRLFKVNDQNAFMLSSAEEDGSGQDVYFTQGDARYVQLAKAAIATGCEILVSNYGMDRTKFEEVCLAGAFGNYLDVDNAQHIGLLPTYEGVPVRSIGNGAGTGVQMYLLDQGIHRKCKKVQENAEHTELNFQEDFRDTYFGEMYFKNGFNEKAGEEEENEY